MQARDFEYVYDTKKEKVVGNEGLKAYTRKVFNYMKPSLGLTAVISYLILRTGLISLFLRVSESGVGYTGLGTLVAWSPLFIIMYMSFSRTIGAKGSKIGLFTIAGLEGASISLLVLYAGVHNAFQAFFLTAILFGSMSLYGYITDKDLLVMGSFLI
ncbi:MAG: Bax inhibitor-1 family protein, partial [Alphaproteobacteria bacterium]|nr:Bax inhibitor-1 family protein [Alphaproteobacteria bacterium]